MESHWDYLMTFARKDSSLVQTRIRFRIPSNRKADILVLSQVHRGIHRILYLRMHAPNLNPLSISPQMTMCGRANDKRSLLLLRTVLSGAEPETDQYEVLGTQTCVLQTPFLPTIPSITRGKHKPRSLHLQALLQLSTVGRRSSHRPQRRRRMLRWQT